MLPPAAVEFAVAPDHPALAGHFPGNPLVPGVVILERAVAAVHAEQSPARIQVVQVKFSSPLRATEPCRIAYANDRNGDLRFECRSGERLIASGLLRLEAVP